MYFIFLVEVCSLLSFDNGQLLTNGNSIFKSGDTVLVACASNYAPVYLATTCQTDRSWSPRPLCTEVMCTVPNLSNGQYYLNRSTLASGTALGYQSVITPSCLIGFSPIPDTPQTCQQNGQWSGQEPNCTAITCNGLPSAFENGTYDVEGNWPAYTFNVSISPKCDQGFFLRQGEVRRCEKLNSWSGETPICSPITCNLPPSFHNGVYNNTQSNYPFGTALIPLCDRGFNLTNNVQSRTCVGQDTWSMENPECHIVKCAELQPIDNGNYNISSGNQAFKYQTFITVTCTTGYAAVNDIWNSTCTENGTWSSVLQCIPIICNDSSEVEHKAIHINSKLAFGDIVNVTYNSTFFVKMNGSLEINCSSEGKLSWISKPYFGKL